jgi:hypothetical protein
MTSRRLTKVVEKFARVKVAIEASLVAKRMSNVLPQDVVRLRPMYVFQRG